MLAHVWNFVALLAFVFCSASLADNAPARPNFVLLLADDQGWAGTSVAMRPDIEGSRSSVIETPRLEKLAESGMVFSAAYAPAPVCAPTRISLQTGQTCAQTPRTTRPSRRSSKGAADRRRWRNVAALGEHGGPVERHSTAPTSRATRRLGPWAPWIRMPSISAVRLEPVIQTASEPSGASPNRASATGKSANTRSTGNSA